MPVLSRLYLGTNTKMYKTISMTQEYLRRLAELTADLADVLDVAAGTDVEITTAKPGLYYSIEAAENVGFTSGKVEGARELATTTTVSPKKPTVTGTPTAVFFRVKVSATPNNN